jgi:hypothetical protein
MSTPETVTRTTRIDSEGGALLLVLAIVLLAVGALFAVGA